MKNSSPKSLSADCRYTVGQLSAGSIPTINRQLTNSKPTHIYIGYIFTTGNVAMQRPCRGGRGGGESHVTRLNFKTSCVSVYKCLSLIVSFDVTVAIWQREVVSCCDFILHTVATFWVMSLVGIYPGRAYMHQPGFMATVDSQ